MLELVKGFLVDFPRIGDTVALFGGLSDPSKLATTLLEGMLEHNRFRRLVTVRRQPDSVCGNA